MLGLKIVCDWLLGPQGRARNWKVCAALAQRLVELPSKKQLRVLSDNIDPLMRELGSELQDETLLGLCKAIQARFHSVSLRSCPLRRFFFLVVQFQNLSSLWYVLRVLVRMHIFGKQLDIFSGSNKSTEEWFSALTKDTLPPVQNAANKPQGHPVEAA